MNYPSGWITNQLKWRKPKEIILLFEFVPSVYRLTWTSSFHCMQHFWPSPMKSCNFFLGMLECPKPPPMDGNYCSFWQWQGRRWRKKRKTAPCSSPSVSCCFKLHSRINEPATIYSEISMIRSSWEAEKNVSSKYWTKLHEKWRQHGFLRNMFIYVVMHDGKTWPECAGSCFSMSARHA